MKDIREALNFLFPNHSCLICRTEINKSKHELICDACVSKLPVSKNTCAKCGQRIGLHSIVCDRCKKAEWHFDKAVSVFVYVGEVVEMVLRLKYNAEGDVAKAVAPFMVNCITTTGLNVEKETPLLIPVPLTPKRLKARGYNQAELLAKEISARTGIPVETSAIARIKQTEKQQDMTAKQRAENLKNAFSVLNKSLVEGKTILLIDDVLTTGATVNECSRMLKKAGAKRVYAITIANTELKKTN